MCSKKCLLLACGFLSFSWGSLWANNRSNAEYDAEYKEYEKYLDLRSQGQTYNQAIETFHTETIVPEQNNAALRKECTSLMEEQDKLDRELKQLNETYRGTQLRVDNAQKELEKWVAAFQKDANFERTLSEKVFREESENVNREIKRFNELVTRLGNEWQALVEQREARCRKGLEKQQEALNYLQREKKGMKAWLGRSHDIFTKPRVLLNQYQSK